MKRARKIGKGKGKHERSFPMGSFVDTLVVFSADFVQVVVKVILVIDCAHPECFIYRRLVLLF